MCKYTTETHTSMHMQTHSHTHNMDSRYLHEYYKTYPNQWSKASIIGLYFMCLQTRKNRIFIEQFPYSKNKSRLTVSLDESHACRLFFCTEDADEYSNNHNKKHSGLLGSVFCVNTVCVILHLFLNSHPSN